MGQRFDSVWDAIEDTPTQAENMRVRAILINKLKECIITKELTQTEAAKLLGVTQPRISDLMNGKINLFSIDVLINMLVKAGMHIKNIELSTEVA